MSPHRQPPSHQIRFKGKLFGEVNSKFGAEGVFLTILLKISKNILMQMHFLLINYNFERISGKIF